MKIILTSFYYKPHFGGIENSLYHLANEYVKNGDDVSILCSDIGLTKKDKLKGYDKIDGVSVYRFKAYVPSNSVFYMFSPFVNVFSCCKFIREKYKDRKNVCVITRHYITGIAFCLCGFKKIIYLIPGVVTYQDKLPLKYRNVSRKTMLVNLFFRIFMLPQNEIIQKFCFVLSTKLFVFSTNMAEQVKSVLGKKNKELFIVKPGVSLDRFCNIDKVQSREQIGVPLDSFIYLCLGRITKHKAMDKAIHAFSTMNDKTNSLLLIVGDGPEKNSLKELTHKLGIQKFVKFYDSTDKPELYYAISDIFLMTSIFEPFGQTIIEAMAANLPVIAFRPNAIDIITASDELIINNETGILVQNSEYNLAEAMQTIKNDEKFRSKLKSNIKNEIQKYSWKNLSEDLIMEK